MSLIDKRTSCAVTLAGLVLTGCGGDTVGGNDQPSVAASFYPLAYVAERVATPAARVVNMTQPGVEAHDMELTGRQVGLIADADLVVYLRGFQPAVDEAVEQNAADRSFDVAEVVPLRDASHDEESAHGDDDAADHADGLDGDPHIWLDPTNMAKIADSLADRLGDVAPDEAASFREHADQLIEELNELDSEYQAGLDNCRSRVLVTSHGAFGYLADRYDLHMVGVAGIDPDAQPSPARLSEVQRVVEAEGVTTIFYERLVSPDVAEALAADLGVATAVLDPIEGLTDETSSEDYFSLMRANLRALMEANGCT